MKKQKMNLCFVSNQFPIIGRTTDRGFLFPICKRLNQQGHSVTVISWKNNVGEKVIERDGITAHFLGESTQLGAQHFRYLALKKFKELSTHKKFDIVHSFDANGIFIGTDKKKFKVKMIYDVDATRLSQLFSLIGLSEGTVSSRIKTGLTVAYMYLKTYFGGDRKLLQTADAVIVHTPQQRQALERHYLYPEKKTHIIPYGIEIGDLSPREKSNEIKKNLDLPPNAKTVVTFTDMTEFELLKNTIHAFEKVAIKKSSARLVIVGDGPLRKKVEYEALSLALGSRIIFTGKVKSDLAIDIISCADVFVSLSAKSSGFEPRLLEAMAQKKVVIGSEVSPISSLIENGKSGFLIRPADVDNLSDLLVKIFTNQIDSTPIGEEARKIILDIINIDSMLKDLLKVYENSLSVKS